MKELLLLFVGSSLTFLGVALRSFLDRRTVASDRLYEARLNALGEIWSHLTRVKRAFGTKLTKGHSRWIEEDSDAAEEEIEGFRFCVDRRQVVLDASVVAVLREIDVYLFNLLSEEEQRSSNYLHEMNQLVKKLEKAVQSSMRKSTHKITLELAD